MLAVSELLDPPLMPNDDESFDFESLVIVAALDTPVKNLEALTNLVERCIITNSGNRTRIYQKRNSLLHSRKTVSSEEQHYFESRNNSH